MAGRAGSTGPLGAFTVAMSRKLDHVIDNTAQIADTHNLSRPKMPFRTDQGWHARGVKLQSSPPASSVPRSLVFPALFLKAGPTNIRSSTGTRQIDGANRLHNQLLILMWRQVLVCFDGVAPDNQPPQPLGQLRA
jgi:hypothetical protein